MDTVQPQIIEFGKVRTTALGDRVHTRDRFNMALGVVVRHITIEGPEDEHDQSLQHRDRQDATGRH